VVELQRVSEAGGTASLAVREALTSPALPAAPAQPQGVQGITSTEANPAAPLGAAPGAAPAVQPVLSPAAPSGAAPLLGVLPSTGQPLLDLRLLASIPAALAGAGAGLLGLRRRR
jgi:hypothetical protein